MRLAGSFGTPPLALLTVLAMVFSVTTPFALRADSEDDWVALFDGKSLDGWRASEHRDTWKVDNGNLVACGERSHLFYDGPVANHVFRNFELKAEVRTQPSANSGIFFHTRYQERGGPRRGYEVEINNTYDGTGKDRELKRTGSLYEVQNTYQSCARDNEWFRIRLRVVRNRICIWVGDHPTVDYFEPENCYRKPDRSGRVLSSGTIALQGHDAGGRVAFRRVAVRLLPDNADPLALERASDQGYGLRENLIDRVAAANVPVIDFHVHLRGGMTIDKSVARQAVTGINVGVVRNLGKGWPLETDRQLGEYLDGVKDRPVFVGVQVNDRDWFKRHSPDLLKRLDFVLGDTMIMPMPADDSPPVKLWIADQYTIDKPEAWMERYVQHNLRVLSEPITILANPTYLPPAVEDMYDALWTEKRMRQVIGAAIDNDVALEINATSGLPHEGFIRIAKKMGAKFTFGSNNFNDRPIDMTRCFQSVDRYGLTKNDLYVPGAQRD